MAANDLTILADVKTELGLTVTTDDAWFARVITAASAFITQYLGRQLVQSTYTSEIYDGKGGTIQLLRNTPISAVASVTINGLAIPASSDNGVLQSGYGFDAAKVWLQGYSFARGSGNVLITYTGGYSPVPFDVAQACIELVALKYREKGRIGEVSKNINGMVVTFSTSDMSEGTKTALLNYRRVAPL